MNEEEKALIEHIVLAYKDDEEYTRMVNVQGIFIQNKDIAYLLDKQQKEIEKLKKFEKYYENEKVVWQRKDYISKEKIREKLEKIEELYNEKAREEKFEYTNNQFIVDFIAFVEELLEI